MKNKLSLMTLQGAALGFKYNNNLNVTVSRGVTGFPFVIVVDKKWAHYFESAKEAYIFMEGMAYILRYLKGRNGGTGRHKRLKISRPKHSGSKPDSGKE